MCKQADNIPEGRPVDDLEVDMVSGTTNEDAASKPEPTEEVGAVETPTEPVVEDSGEPSVPSTEAEVEAEPKSFDLSKLDDPDFDDPELMSQIYEETVRNFTEGEVVKARVIEVARDRVLVDIMYKSEGTVSLSEFQDGEEVNVGDEFDVFIEEPEGEDGTPVLSKIKADRIKNWTNIQKVYEDDGSIEGKITRRVKGGFKADIGLDAFLPASQVSLRPAGDLDKYIGESYKFKIIKLTKRRRNVVISHRKHLEDLQADRKEELLDTIEEGQIINGEVKNVTDFGAFVDVGGIDGLLHVTDMSWGRVKHPSNVVKVGDEIDVMVLRFDPETERISLGLKQKTQNPWLTVDERYEVGSIVAGRLVSMTDYGAFVQLEPGVEGMVHVSEMSWTRRVRHPSELLELDQDVDVMVLNIDKENQKIALGLKQTKPNPWFELETSYPVGTTIEGEIRNLTDYGAFIQIDEGIDGLLHVSDMSWTKKVAHPSEMMERGGTIKVKILSIDPHNEKVSLGLKQLEEDPWLGLPEKYNLGDHIEVVISKLVSFGAFATLDCGIEGLIHVSELSRERVAKPENVVSVGDKVTVKIIGIDPNERKIGLSIKDYQRDIEDEVKTEYGGSAGDSSVSVGEIVGEAVPPNFVESGQTLEQAMLRMMAEDKAERDAENTEPETETPAETGEEETATGEPETEDSVETGEDSAETVQEDDQSGETTPKADSTEEDTPTEPRQ